MSSIQNPEVQNNSPEKINSEEVINHYEKLKNSGEKGTFEKTTEKITKWSKEVYNGVNKDIKEKNWGKLLLKGAVGLGGLFLAKKATELVTSTTKSILGILGFGNEKAGEGKEKTEGSLLGILTKIGLGGTAATLIYEAFKGKLGLSDYIGKSPSEIAIMLIGKIKDGGIEMTDDLKNALYSIPGAKMILDFFFKKEKLPARTDRNNNPAAIIYEGFAKNLKDLNYKEGEDFEEGDEFTDEFGKKYHTIKFKTKEIGVKATIKLIDKVGFYNDSLGQNRWKYTDKMGMNNENWEKLDENGKLEFLKKMYKHEGGNGKFFDGISVVDGGIEKSDLEKIKEKAKGVFSFIIETNKSLKKDFTNSEIAKKYGLDENFLNLTEVDGESTIDEITNWLIKKYNGSVDKILDISGDLAIGYIMYKFGFNLPGLVLYSGYGMSKKHEIVNNTIEHMADPIRLADEVLSGNCFVEPGKSGGLFISTILQGSLFYHTMQITGGFMETFLSQLEKGDTDGLVLIGAGGIAFGKVLYSGGQAQYEILTGKEFSFHPIKGFKEGKWTNIENLGYNTNLRYENKYIIRTLKSLAFPITRESRYIAKSMIETIPGIKTIEKFHLDKKMSKAEMYLNDIKDIKKEFQSGNISEAKAKTELTKYTEKIEEIIVNKEALKKFPTSKIYYKFYNSLEETAGELKNLLPAARGEKGSIEKYFNQLDIFEEKFQKNKSLITDIFAKYETFKTGRYFKALGIDKIFSGEKPKTPEVKTETLESESKITEVEKSSKTQELEEIKKELEKNKNLAKNQKEKLQKDLKKLEEEIKKPAHKPDIKPNFEKKKIAEIKPEIPKPKISNFGKLKKFPKGKAGLLLGLGIATYAAANEITGNNDKNLEGKKNEKTYDNKNLKKNPVTEKIKESEKNILKLIPQLEINNQEKKDVANSLGDKIKGKTKDEVNQIFYKELKKEYPEKFKKFNKEKEEFLENYKNRKNLKNKLEKFGTDYKNFLSEVKKNVLKNKDNLKKELGVNDKMKISDTIYLTKNNNGNLELKYISEDKYSEFIHSQFQKEPSGNTTIGIPDEVAKEVGTGMIPFYGSGRDLKRSVEKFESGNYSEAWSDLKWGVIGMIFDITSVGAAFLTAPFLGAGGVGVQAAKAGILGSMRGIKAAKTLSRLTKTAKISGGGMLGMTIYDFGKNPENFDKSEIIK